MYGHKKKVLITGGSRGLGLAMAEEFAQQNYEIMLIARDFIELEKARSLLNQKFPLVQISILDIDLLNSEAPMRIKNEVEQKWGHVDVVINNAGAILVGPLDSMTIEDFRSQMEIHFFVPLKIIKEFIPLFEKNGGGHFVNICSMGGKVAVPNMLTYDASKFALAGLSQGLSAELKEKNINVLTVYPSLMMTGSPIQAIFKGDSIKEFEWFASADYLPVLSVNPETVARRIFKGINSKKSELVIPWFANLRILGSAHFPNLMIKTMQWMKRKLPKGSDTSYRSGAEVKNFAPVFNKYFLKKSTEIERRWNQYPKSSEQLLQKMDN